MTRRTPASTRFLFSCSQAAWLAVVLPLLCFLSCGPLPAHMGGREHRGSTAKGSPSSQLVKNAPKRQEQPAATASGRKVNRGDPEEGTRASSKRKQDCETILPLVQEIAPKYELEVFLVLGLIKVESGFNAEISSRVGARGLMQIMPRTAEHMKCGDDLFDPRTNIECGCKVLRTYLDRYKGDQIFGLAAYNAGPGNVNKAASDKITPFNFSYPEKVLRWKNIFERNGCT